jgi:hypothetical protein
MWIRSPRSSTERRSSRFLAAALAAALCLAPGAAAAQERTPDEIRQRARSVLTQDYQKELPEPAPLPRMEFPIAFGPLAYLALMILVALGVAALILAMLWLAGNLRSAKERAAAAPGQPGSLAEETAGETGPSLAEAERLAAAGRWSEAVHALLLIAVRRLCARFAIPQASSRTSRELCRALPLQGEAREAFTGLVRTVEVSLFGGAPLGPDDWRTSLERFRRIEGRG